MEEMGKHHLRAGKDIALAGIDDLEISSLDRISLTSIRQPHKKIALEAVENLLANISSPAHTVRKKLSPELIIRKTTSGFKNKKRKNK
jgi:DNA-binding LacI/PurR family transcriptional regulator